MSNLLQETTSQSEGSETLLNFGAQSRIRLILQSEAAECGLACLAMVASAYGLLTDLNALRKKYPSSLQGTDIKNLTDYADSMKLNSRALRVDPEELDQVQLPCILHWETNHFVVLTAIKRNQYSILDPALGERKIDRATFNKKFTGVLLELFPSQSFEPMDERKKLGLNHFWTKIYGLKSSLANILILSLCLEVFAILSPFYMQVTVDQVIATENSSLAAKLAIGFGFFLGIQLFVSAFREWMILYFSSRLSMQMATNLFHHLIRLPLDFFSKRHMGDLVSRFGSLNQVRHIFTTAIVAAILDGLMAVITLIAMFFYSSTLSLIVICALTVYVISRIYLYQPLKLLNEEALVVAAKENSHFMESLRAMQAIKIFQREADRQHQWQNRLADVINRQIQISRLGIQFNLLNGFIFGVENIVVIYLASTAVIDNVFSLGMLYAFMSYKTSFTLSIDKLINQYIEYRLIDIHLDRLSDIAFAEKEVCHQESNVNQLSNHQKLIQGKITVKNLGFKFSGQNNFIFRHLNFEIPAGESVAIMGASGCGKSTLVKCLMGLISPTEGEIFIDDFPLTQLSNYRSQIAGVMQDDQLITGDIFDNISFFDTKPNQQKVHNSARLAAIEDDILRMPMQFNSLVGDMGSALSGGQKQRVILARALYREPRILFMDEATSHLDVENESLVNKNIKELAITRVIVAHRPETVMCAGMQINLADFNNL